MKKVIKNMVTNSELIINNNSSNLIEIVKDKFSLTVYGELCGGMYRHPDVEKVTTINGIQKRIDYHPDIKWIPFDIILRNETNEKIYLCTTEEVKIFCDKVDLPSQIKKFEGTLDECLNYPNDFIDDTGHILWGLPLIDNNITEGVVIKPIIPLWMGNGQRVIIKNKNDKFKERMNKVPKVPKVIIPMNELEKKYFNIICEYITESRLCSVISKIGEIDNKMFGKVQGLFVQDILNDFKKEYGEEIDKLEKELDVDSFNFKKVQSSLQKEAGDFFRPKFVDIINN